MITSSLQDLLKNTASEFHPVVSFDATTQRLKKMDLTRENPTLDANVFKDIDKFCAWVDAALQSVGAIYGIGGYDEHRNVYALSDLFGSGEEEPRRLHLGTDIWGAVGTPIYACYDAQVHSIAFNDHYGDYGATLILSHNLEGHQFHTLYGHISLKDIQGLQQGDPIQKGTVIAHFGAIHENGHWPPHLHFQIISEMDDWEGDYPGVCKFSERLKYLENGADPDLILQLNQYL